MWRSGIALGFLVLPFLPSDAARIWVLLGTLFAFLAMRAVGFTAQQAVMKAVTRADELPQVVALQGTWWQISSIAISLVVAGVLWLSQRLPDPLWAYYALLCAGVVLNFCGALALRRLPATGPYAGGSALAVLGAVPFVLRDQGRREVVLLTLLSVPMGLAAGYQLNHLRLVLGLADGTVFAVTLAGMVVALGGTRLAGSAGVGVGFRPLQLGAHAALAAVGLLMAANGLLPEGMRVAAAVAGFLLASLCLSISGTVLWALTIDRLGEHRRAEVSTVFLLVATLAAGSGLGLVALARHLDAAAPASGAYRHAFLVWSVFSLGICLMSLRLRRPGAGVWSDVALLHPLNVITAIRLQRHSREDASDPEQRHALEDLLASGAPAARRQRAELLRSPDVHRRAAALAALVRDPDATLAASIADLVDEAGSPVRPLAIAALAAIGDAVWLPRLRACCDDADRAVAVAARCVCIALDDLPPATIGAWYAATASRGDRLALLTALADARRRAALHGVLQLELSDGAQGDWLRTVLLAVASPDGLRQDLTQLWSDDDRRPGAGHQFVMQEIAHDARLVALAQAGGAAVARGLGLPGAPETAAADALLLLAARGVLPLASPRP
jgi:hypothetical protein